MTMELSLTDNSRIYARLKVSTLMFVTVTLLRIISPASQLILSSSNTVFLCPSEQLVLTCISNVSFLQWRITDVQGISDTRIVAYDITSYPALTVGATEFRFSLSSQLSALPHISQIQADRVANGTMISCSVSVQGNIRDTRSTTICIIGSECGPVAPELTVSAEQFELTGVVTIIEWISLRDNRVSYNVNIFPDVPIAFLGNTSVRVTIPYDIQFMVNVSAMLCGEITTTVKNLLYASASCGNPTIQIDNFVTISEYSEPAVRGSTIIFSCPTGFVLTGSNSSTCMENGEWEPDPREMECTSLDTSTIVHITSLSSTEGSSEALSQERKIAVASSVTVFIVTAILFFIIGFLCGCFYQKKKKSASETTSPAGGQTQVPYYEDVVLKQELELKENVAYGPIQIIR